MSYYEYGYNRGGFLSNVPPVTKNIIMINVLIFIATIINQGFMIEHFAMFYPSSPFFRPWQIITHMFMHGGFWHIFLNMYTLLIFGMVLERRLGTKRFLIFYFVTGLGAALLHTGVEFLQATSLIASSNAGSVEAAMAYHRMLGIPTLGASGAIYGVLLGYAMLFPDSVLTLLFPPISLSAKWFAIIFAGIELFTGIFVSGDGVAHFAHLGGMIFGFILITTWRKTGKIY